MAKYKASYQLGTKSTTSEARKRKEQRRWKEEKSKLTACENRRKRTCLIFRSLGGVPLAEDFEPDIFGIPRLETVDCETLHMFTSKTDKGCLRDLCRANCFAREAHWGDCLGILHMFKFQVSSFKFIKKNWENTKYDVPLLAVSYSYSRRAVASH